MRFRRSFDATTFSDFQVDSTEAHTRLPRVGDYASIFFQHKGRLAHKWTQYFEAYDREFGPYRTGFSYPDNSQRPLKFLEIGVFHGGSLEIWRKFFGADAEIWGIDIDDRCAAITDRDLNIRIGSQADPDFLNSVVDEMGGVDIVLDDGSHVFEHQMVALKALFPRLSYGGVYAVEDLHTSYWRSHGGGPARARGGAGFNGWLAQLVHALHSHYQSTNDQQRSHDWFPSRELSHFSIWDSLAFLHKAPPTEPMVTKQGTPSW